MRSDDVFNTILAALQNGPIIVQLPTVYAVVAPATLRGAAWLDAIKGRLPGKNYGTLTGAGDRFWAMAEELPAAQVAPLSAAADVFFRVRIGSPDLNTPAVRAGTHQSLPLSGPARTLMRTIEDAFEPEPALFGGHRYSAPLASSWNLSGAPGGSITTRPEALALARARGVALFVTGPSSSMQGSYPILEPEADGLAVRRSGPGLDAVLAALESPASSRES